METFKPSHSELPPDLMANIVKALHNGVDPNIIKEIINEEAKKMMIKDNEERERKIQEELKAIIDRCKRKVSIPEDFEAVREKQKKRWEWEASDWSEEEKDEQVNLGFNYYEKEPAGRAFILSNNSEKLILLYKGTDGQLYSVEFDLTELLINGEKVKGYKLEGYLEDFSPFIFPKDAPYRFVNDFMENLYWASHERRSQETAQIKEIKSDDLLKNFDI